MTWDIATARAVMKYPPADTTHDVALQIAMDTTLATVENLLGRGLFRQRETRTFYNVDRREIRLPRWPIERVISPKCRIVHHRVGWIELQSWSGECLEVDYIGGFDPLPSDLEHALWGAFETFYGTIDPVTGHPVPGSGPTVVQGGGEVDRISLSDFGTVSFNYGVSTVGGGSGNVSARHQELWGWLAPWASILSIYRSESAPSIAFA